MVDLPMERLKWLKNYDLSKSKILTVIPLSQQISDPLIVHFHNLHPALNLLPQDAHLLKEVGHQPQQQPLF